MTSNFTKVFSVCAVATGLLSACVTTQENPNYQYSTKYKAEQQANSQLQQTFSNTPQTVQSAGYQNAEYQNTEYQAGQSYQQSANSGQGYHTQPLTYTRPDHECLRRQTNRELIGAGVGGTAGAIIGKKLTGGTKGTLIGAGLGGAAGYGVGDKTIDCDPVTVVNEQHPSYASQPTSYYPDFSPTTTYQANPAPTDMQFQPISNEGTPGYQVLAAQTELPPVQSTGAREVAYDYSSNVISVNSDVKTQAYETRASDNRNLYSVREGDTVYSLSRQLCSGVSDIAKLNQLNESFSIKIGQDLRLPQSQCQ